MPRLDASRRKFRLFPFRKCSRSRSTLALVGETRRALILIYRLSSDIQTVRNERIKRNPFTSHQFPPSPSSPHLPLPLHYSLRSVAADAVVISRQLSSKHIKREIHLIQTAGNTKVIINHSIIVLMLQQTQAPSTADSSQTVSASWTSGRVIRVAGHRRVENPPQPLAGSSSAAPTVVRINASASGDEVEFQNNDQVQSPSSSTAAPAPAAAAAQLTTENRQTVLHISAL